MSMKCSQCRGAGIVVATAVRGDGRISMRPVACACVAGEIGRAAEVMPPDLIEPWAETEREPRAVSP